MKDKLKLLPAAIGSLPHDNAQVAIDFLYATFPQLPVWPQLSNVNIKEDMIIQFTQKIPGVVFDEAENRWFFDSESDEFFEQLEEFYLDYESIINEGQLELLDKYAITGEFSSSIPLFLEKLKTTKPIAAKGQITGPFTWGTSLVDRDKKCAFYDETLKEVVIKGLTLKALWQVYEIKKHSSDTIPLIFFDEPTMSQFGTSAFITVSREDIISSINEIADILHQHGAVIGIHCCGKTDWSLVTQSNVDMINFDAYCFAESLALYAKEVEEFIKKGGMIAWGIVPTLDTDALDSTSIEELLTVFENAKGYLIEKGIDEQLLIDSSLFTPTCGMGGLTIEQSKRAAEFTSELSKLLKQKYDGGN